MAVSKSKAKKKTKTKKKVTKKVSKQAPKKRAMRQAPPTDLKPRNWEELTPDERVMYYFTDLLVNLKEPRTQKKLSELHNISVGKEQEREPFQWELDKYGPKADSLAYELAVKGKKLNHIAQIIGVNRATVYRWMDKYATFSYHFTRGRQKYVSQLIEEMSESLAEGESIRSFARRKKITRDEIYDLEKESEDFKKAKANGMFLHTGYWEELSRKQSDGDMLAIIQVGTKTYQGKVVIDPETKKPVKEERAIAKPFSADMTKFRMSHLPGYREQDKNNDDAAGSALDRALARHRQRSEKGS